MKLSSANRRRRAMAPLEYVLVFPFLLGIACVLFAIARADISKLGAVTVSRRQTWLQSDQPNAGNQLAPLQDLQGAQVGRPAQVPAPLGPMFGGRVDQAASKTTTLADPWGFSTVQFAPLPQNCQPHTDVVGLISSNIAPPEVVSTAFTPLHLFDPTNPVLQEGGAIMSVGNTLVQAAGWYLDGGGTVGAFFKAADTGVQVALDAAQATPVGGIINGISKAFGGGDGLIDKLKDLSHKITHALDVFDKLNRAAQGQPDD